MFMTRTDRVNLPEEDLTNHDSFQLEVYSSVIKRVLRAYRLEKLCSYWQYFRSRTRLWEART